MQNGFFKTFDGLKLFYSIEGSGPPLLFCYGLVCSKLHWNYQMEYFKKNYTVIWFDYRGHHLSDSPENPEQLTIDNIARDAESLLDELGIKQVTLLGHSMGVNLVLELYKRAPERVKALVLANGSARGPLETMFRSNITQLAFPHIFRAYRKYPKLANLIWAAQGRSKVVPWLVGQLGFNPNLTNPKDIEIYVQKIAKMDMIVTLQLLQDYENYDATPWLSEIKVPTLIIAGENDLIIPREAQEVMHQLIPNSKFELIRHGSHCPQMDIPDLINIILERFLTDVHSSPKSESKSSPRSAISSAQRSRHGEPSKP